MVDTRVDCSTLKIGFEEYLKEGYKELEIESEADLDRRISEWLYEQMIYDKDHYHIVWMMRKSEFDGAKNMRELAWKALCEFVVDHKLSHEEYLVKFNIQPPCQTCGEYTDDYEAYDGDCEDLYHKGIDDPELEVTVEKYNAGLPGFGKVIKYRVRLHDGEILMDGFRTGVEASEYALSKGFWILE